MQDNYLRSMKADANLAKAYFAKSIIKTEQQKALESLLSESVARGELDFHAPYNIADLACGGGTLSYHLAPLFPNANFVLLDYNEDGLELAKEINSESRERMTFIQGDLRDLPLKDASFDLVFCSQTLGWIEKNDIACVLHEMIRILKPHARLYASSLFNTEFDVDLYTNICDRTRPSSFNPHNPKAPLINGCYNTYCKQTIIEMCESQAKSIEILPFYPCIDFARDMANRGIGSFTLQLNDDDPNARPPRNALSDAAKGGGGGRHGVRLQRARLPHAPHHISRHAAQLGLSYHHQIVLAPKAEIGA